MPVIAEIQGAPGHYVSVMTVASPSGGEQGHARCTCGWSNSDIFPDHTYAAALTHAKAAQ